MSLNKFTTTDKGLDIDLAIGCDTLSCNTLLVDGKDITSTGDFETLTVDTNTKFNATDITTGEKVQYLTQNYDYGDFGTEQKITGDIFLQGNGYSISGGIGSELNCTTSPGGKLIFKDVVFDGSRNKLEFIGADYEVLFDNCVFANLNSIAFFVDGGTMTIQDCTFKPFFFSSFSSIFVNTGTTNTARVVIRNNDLDVSNITINTTYIINISGSKCELELIDNIFRNVACRPIQFTNSSVLEGGAIEGNVFRSSPAVNFPVIEGKLSSTITKALSVTNNAMSYDAASPLIVNSVLDNDRYIYAKGNVECAEYLAVHRKYMTNFTQLNFSTSSGIFTPNWASRPGTYNNKRAIISDNNYLEPNGRILHNRPSGGTTVRIRGVVNLISFASDGTFYVRITKDEPGVVIEEYGPFSVPYTVPSTVFQMSFDFTHPFEPEQTYQIYIQNLGGTPVGETSVLVDDFTIEEI